MFRISLFVLAFLPLCHSTICAQGEKNEFGVSVGLLTAGEYYVAEFDVYQGTGSGLMLHTFYDHFVAEHFGLGVFFSFSRPELNFFEEPASYTEVGLALKPRFFLGDNFTVKPGLNLGYRVINESFIEDPVTGLGIDLTTEIQFNIAGAFKPYVDLGFITQPTGGNEDSDITFGPVFNARIGLAIPF